VFHFQVKGQGRRSGTSPPPMTKGGQSIHSQWVDKVWLGNRSPDHSRRVEEGLGDGVEVDWKVYVIAEEGGRLQGKGKVILRRDSCSGHVSPDWDTLRVGGGARVRNSGSVGGEERRVIASI